MRRKEGRVSNANFDEAMEQLFKEMVFRFAQTFDLDPAFMVALLRAHADLLQESIDKTR